MHDRQSLLGSATTAWPIPKFDFRGALLIVPQNSWPRVIGRTSFVIGCGFVVGMDIGPYFEFLDQMEMEKEVVYIPISYSWRSEPHIPPQAMDTMASLSFTIGSGASTTRTSRIPKYCAALMVWEFSRNYKLIGFLAYEENDLESRIC
jgi:hypothetical protein